MEFKFYHPNAFLNIMSVVGKVRFVVVKAKKYGKQKVKPMCPTGVHITNIPIESIKAM